MTAWQPVCASWDMSWARSWASSVKMNLRVLKNQYFLYFFSALKGASLFPPPIYCGTFQLFPAAISRYHLWMSSLSIVPMICWKSPSQEFLHKLTQTSVTMSSQWQTSGFSRKCNWKLPGFCVRVFGNLVKIQCFIMKQRSEVIFLESVVIWALDYGKT